MKSFPPFYLLLIILLGSGCEECAFCEGTATTYLNGEVVEVVELPITKYCDELLEELQENPTDTFIRDQGNQDIWMRVTENECL